MTMLDWPMHNSWCVLTSPDDGAYDAMSMCVPMDSASEFAGFVQRVQKDRTKAIKSAIVLSLHSRDGCFYRAVPVPYSGRERLSAQEREVGS